MAGNKGKALPAMPGLTVNNMLGFIPPTEPVLLFNYQTSILVK